MGMLKTLVFGHFNTLNLGAHIRAGPVYKWVKQLLEAPKKLKKLTGKKGPKFKEKKNTHNLKEFWKKEKRKKKR